MEPVEIVTAMARDFSYLLTNHPALSAFGVVIVFLLLVRFYCRLTLGICDCDEQMVGKTVFITGATAGIGKATAEDLARRGARLILGCRDVEKGRRVAEQMIRDTGNRDISLQQIDLASYASVRRSVRDILNGQKELHVLINNAGILGSDKETTEDGCETIMQSNHLGHFLLTLSLIDLLKKSRPSRIVNVSSSAHTMGKLDLDALKSKKFSSFQSYCNSKLANVLFTRELASRLEGTGVTVNAVHPGAVKTDIIKGFDSIFKIFTGIFIFWVGKNAKEGAQTTIYAAVHPELEKTTGKYFADCKEEILTKIALSDSQARKLWKISEEITGISSN